MDNVCIIDSAADEFQVAREPNVLRQKDPGPSQKHTRDAVMNTNLSVFRFPWEKGRLAAIFSPAPVVKVPVPKLSPGGRNAVQLDLTIGEGGSCSAQAALKSKPVAQPAFLQIVKKI